MFVTFKIADGYVKFYCFNDNQNFVLLINEKQHLFRFYRFRTSHKSEKGKLVDQKDL